MSSEVLERQLEDDHEVRLRHLSPLDPDCRRVIVGFAVGVAQRLNKAGWLRGERVECLRGDSPRKTEMVNLHPLDPPGSGAGKGRPAYAVTKLGKLYSRLGNRPWAPVKLHLIDLMERKRLEVLIGFSLRAR